MNDAFKASRALREPETFREFIHLRVIRKDLRFQTGDKLGTYELLQKIGAPVPKVYRVFEGAADVDLRGLPDEFVIKPSGMAGGRGIYILHKIAGDQGYWDSMKQTRRWSSQIKKLFAKWEEHWREKREGKPFRIMAEERVVGEVKHNAIPIDYKFYTFNGTIRLILQIDRNASPNSIRFYDGDFSEWDWRGSVEPNLEKLQIGDPVIPSCAREMLNVASRTSRLLRTPYCSIDMYASKRGPLIGELTKSPGGPYYAGLFAFSRAFDEELAREWRRASKELSEEIYLIDPADPIPRRSRFALPKNV